MSLLADLFSRKRIVAVAEKLPSLAPGKSPGGDDHSLELEQSENVAAENPRRCPRELPATGRPLNKTLTGAAVFGERRSRNGGG